MSIAEKVYETQLNQLGTEIGISPWIKIDQNMINKFADVTLDPQFIHVDENRAKLETPFGGTIAHGFLSLSLASKFAIDTFPPQTGQVMGINYGLNKVRFFCSHKIRNGTRTHTKRVSRVFYSRVLYLIL